jgi:hypothetical protein
VSGVQKNTLHNACAANLASQLSQEHVAKSVPAFKCLMLDIVLCRTFVCWLAEGESNEQDPLSYNCTFPAMIAAWRQAWHAATHGETSLEFRECGNNQQLLLLSVPCLPHVLVLVVASHRTQRLASCSSQFTVGCLATEARAATTYRHGRLATPQSAGLKPPPSAPPRTPRCQGCLWPLLSTLESR